MLRLEKYKDRATLYAMGRSGSKSLSYHVWGYSYSDRFLDYKKFTVAERLRPFVRPEDVVQLKVPQVLVLRNPKERFISGHALWTAIEKSKSQLPRHYDQTVYYPMMNHPQFNNYDRFMAYHGAPFLHRINCDITFKILPFENLSEYTDKNESGPGPQDPGLTERKWGDNDYDWDTEMSLYNKLINEKERVTVEEFNKWFS